MGSPASRGGRELFEVIIDMGLSGHEQVGGEEKRVNMLNEKGFWEGGVITNTYGDVNGLASFQL